MNTPTVEQSAKLTEDDSRVWWHISLADRTSPRSIRQLAEETGMNDRSIKASVEHLRFAGIAVCASRVKPNGYYIAKTADDVRDAVRPMVSQAKTMLLNASRLCSKQTVREMLGQDVLAEVGE